MTGVESTVIFDGKQGDLDMEKKYFHLFANGDDAKGFIICERDFIFEFNAIAVCSYESGATVICFSLEDSHPHILLYGTKEECLHFLTLFEDMSLRHIVRTRGSLDGVILKCELYHVKDENYLRNVAVYVIFQPTKDGKPVMYYDYKWGTGSMYFRSEDHIPVWRVGRNAQILTPQPFAELTYREKYTLCRAHHIPDGWLVCDGLILPENYVNVRMFEQIYHTHNCFRTFVGAGNRKSSVVDDTMSEIRGVMIDDLEARRMCSTEAVSLFGTKDIRRMDIRSRYLLAKSLRQKYSITHRQLATLTRIQESELRKYLK